MSDLGTLLHRRVSGHIHRHQADLVYIVEILERLFLLYFHSLIHIEIVQC